MDELKAGILGAVQRLTRVLVKEVREEIGGSFSNLHNNQHFLRSIYEKATKAEGH